MTICGLVNQGSTIWPTEGVRRTAVGILRGIKRSSHLDEDSVEDHEKSREDESADEITQAGLTGRLAHESDDGDDDQGVAEDLHDGAQLGLTGGELFAHFHVGAADLGKDGSAGSGVEVHGAVEHHVEDHDDDQTHGGVAHESGGIEHLHDVAEEQSTGQQADPAEVLAVLHVSFLNDDAGDDSHAKSTRRAMNMPLAMATGLMPR